MTKYPERLTLELSSKCNLDCLFCPRHKMTDPLGNMSVHGFKSLCDQAKGNVKTGILFWRGESTKHPMFIDLVRYARERFERLEFATNGKGWNHFMRIVIPMFDFFSVSVHEAGAVEFAKNAAAIRKGHGYMQVTCVKGERTEKAVKGLVQELPGGINRVKIYDRHTVEGGWGSVRSGGTVNTNAEQTCPRLSTDLCVGWNGGMSRCTHVWETSQKANIFKLGLEKAWNIAQRMPWDHCKKCDQNGQHTKGKNFVPGT